MRAGPHPQSAARKFSLHHDSHNRSSTLDSPRAIGVLRKWSPDRSFGFLKSTLTKQDYFLHTKQIRLEDRKRIMCGQLFDFIPVDSPRGLIACEAFIVPPDDSENETTV
jgi:cold shock CspA family protein